MDNNGYLLQFLLILILIIKEFHMYLILVKDYNKHKKLNYGIHNNK